MIRLILRLTLVAVGAIALITSQPSSAQAAVTTFKIEQKADQWLILDTPFNTTVGWGKDFIAIGPYKWTTTVKKLDGTDFANESWQAPAIVNCHKTPNLCRPGGTNERQWLWGFGTEEGPLSQNYNFEYRSVGSEELILNTDNSNCGRGVGPAIAFEPGCDKTLAIYATAPYGWTYGSLARNAEYDGPYVSGMMMPLRWEVRGYYSTTPPPAAPGN